MGHTLMLRETPGAHDSWGQSEKRYIKSVIHPRTRSFKKRCCPGRTWICRTSSARYISPGEPRQAERFSTQRERHPRSDSPKPHRSEEVVNYRVQSTPNRKILSKFDLICSSSSAIRRRFSHHGYIFVSRSRRLHPLRTSTWMATSRGVMIWLLCSVHMLIATHCNIREPSYTRTDYDRKFGGRLFLFSPEVEP